MPNPYLSPRGHTLEQLISSSFTGADEDPLSEGSVWSTITSENAFKRASNTAQPNNVGADCGSRYSGITWPADHYSQAKLTVTGTTGGGAGIGLHLRAASGARTYYRFVVDHATSNNAEIRRVVAGSGTVLTTWTQPFTDGDQFTFGVQGTQLFVMDKNGRIVATAQDGQITSGSPGIEYSSTETSASVDDWSGGKFSLLAQPTRRSGPGTRSKVGFGNILNKDRWV